MKKFLIVDLILQVLLILFPLFFLGHREGIKFSLVYVAVLLGAWQVLSSLIHLMVQRKKTSIARRAYSVAGIIFGIAVLFLISDKKFSTYFFNAPDTVVYTLPSLMAAYYFGLTVYELLNTIQKNKEGITPRI